MARAADKSARFLNWSHGSVGHIMMRALYLAGMLSVPALGASFYGFEQLRVPSVIVLVVVVVFTLIVRVLEAMRKANT